MFQIWLRNGAKDWWTASPIYIDGCTRLKKTLSYFLGEASSHQPTFEHKRDLLPEFCFEQKSLFLVACNAPLQLTILVCRLVGWYILFLLFWYISCFFALWNNLLCPLSNSRHLGVWPCIWPCSFKSPTPSQLPPPSYCQSLAVSLSLSCCSSLCLSVS